MERHIEASGLSWTFLRPNGFMQNFLHMAEQISAVGDIYMPAGDARISQIDVRDIARVASKALTDSEQRGRHMNCQGLQHWATPTRRQHCPDYWAGR
ncbi:MAG: NmrA family NAD(P)-binding protein [Pararhodobacter sp.]|nr:NmrA family NAD(P)-binding protein [Pararhodobacter sp.]